MTDNEAVAYRRFWQRLLGLPLDPLPPPEAEPEAEAE